MKIKTQRSGLLCLLFLALSLLAGASHGQETRKQLEESISKLRAEEQYLEEYRAELQHDLRELDDDESGPSQYVVVTTRRPFIFEERGMYALMPKEAWANMIALEVLLGDKTPLEAAVRTRHILSETKAFPREARKKIVEIGEELAEIKNELSALQAQLARLRGSDGSNRSRAGANGRDSQRPAPRSGSASLFTVEDNTFFRGQVSYAHFVVTNHQACQDACAKDPRCHLYTYYRPIGATGAKGNCDLHPKMEWDYVKEKNDACCILGVKKQPL